MAFQVHDLGVVLMSGGQPGGCTCGPASGVTGGACPDPSSADRKGESKADGLSKLTDELRKSISSTN